jgi:protein involved in polysaccharide export with SLBB domain
MKKAFSAATAVIVLAFTAQASFTQAQIKEPRAVSASSANAAPRDEATGQRTNLDAGATKPGKSEKKDKKKSNAEKSAAVAPNTSITRGSEAKSDVAKINATGKATGSLPAATPTAPNAASVTTPALTSLYRVGVGDVLDIRLLNTASRESSLYSVLSNGFLEYPLAGEAFSVSGLTTDEIAARLASKIKVYDKPQVTVGVREYASHNVIVTGLVDNPGSKILRREAVPLYVVLAEALPRAEAARATIMRGGSQNITLDLTNQTATGTLVMPGDLIRLTAAPPLAPQFFFIGGQVNAPGQKDFHAGLTLTQAILASGGTTRFAGDKIKVSRQGADGRLAVTEYKLKLIEDGKIPDPHLQPGDRIEVGRGHW